MGIYHASGALKWDKLQLHRVTGEEGLIKKNSSGGRNHVNLVFSFKTKGLGLLLTSRLDSSFLIWIPKIDAPKIGMSTSKLAKISAS